jgi:hypothetical protein
LVNGILQNLEPFIAVDLLFLFDLVPHGENQILELGVVLKSWTLVHLGIDSLHVLELLQLLNWVDNLSRGD